MGNFIVSVDVVIVVESETIGSVDDDDDDDEKPVIFFGKIDCNICRYFDILI